MADKPPLTLGRIVRTGRALRIPLNTRPKLVKAKDVQVRPEPVPAPSPVVRTPRSEDEARRIFESLFDSPDK